MEILIAEDNEDSSAMLTLALTARGYGVVSCVNGVEALRSARAALPDLIISDILMPEMDGFELCRQAKADPELKRVPFIFYTATYTEHRDEALAMALGACRYLIKPMEPKMVVDIIQKVIATNQAEKLRVPQGANKENNELEEMHL